MRGPETTGWLIDGKGRREIRWKRLVKETISLCQHCKFELNAVFDGQPMKLKEEGCDMVALAFTKDKTGCTVLDTLKAVELIRW